MLIYQNDTKNVKPLKRLFKFDQDVVVTFNGKETKVSSGKYISLNVERRGKVFATAHPVDITGG